MVLKILTILAGLTLAGTIHLHNSAISLTNSSPPSVKLMSLCHRAASDPAICLGQTVEALPPLSAYVNQLTSITAKLPY